MGDFLESVSAHGLSMLVKLLYCWGGKKFVETKLSVDVTAMSRTPVIRPLTLDFR